MSKLSRRTFLTRTGALVLGFSFPLLSVKGQDNQSLLKPEKQNDKEGEDRSADKYHNAYIEITSNNEIIFQIPDIEFGQGIYTAASMLLAEELEVELSAVKVKAALPSSEYILKGEITEITWGSGSTQKDWIPLQYAGATLRMMLVEAAAQLWNVNLDQCHAKAGKIHGPGNLQYTYAQLIETVYTLPIPKDIALKKEENYYLIGKSQPRVDTPAKINGTAIYATDVPSAQSHLANMKIGYVITCPVIGGKIAFIHNEKAKQVKGVLDIITLQDSVCIITDNSWAAAQASKLLEIGWDFGVNATVTTNSIYNQLKQAADKKAIICYSNNSEKIETSLAETSRIYKMSYRQPMLAHAALEPLSCTIIVDDKNCEIWSCSQTPIWTQERIAKLLNRDKKKITFHNVYVGGSLGRRLDDDYILQAVQFAQKTSYPLRCVWSREQDFMQDHVRPPYLDKIEVGVDGDGLIKAVKHQIIGPSVMARWDKTQLSKNGMDPDLLSGIDTLPYQILHYQLNYTRCDIDAIIPGWWQGNGATRNIFVLESIINKCAIKAKKDPIEYRKELKPDPRAVAVMDMVSQHAQWDQPPPKDIGRGFALAHVFNSYIAMIVEAEVTAMSVVRLHRVIAAVDCGLAVNPDQIAAQIESGAIIGLGSALYNEVEIEQGQIAQRSFSQYRVLHMNESPQIEVHIIKSDKAPSGVGDLGTVVAAPALAHALGSILNKQLYSLPLNKYMN